MLLATLALLLTACDVRDDDDDTIALDADDDGTTIQLAVGERLTITLKANPSVGFTWQVAAVDEAVLRPVGEAEFEAERPDLVGGGGVEVLTFDAVALGTTELALDQSYRGDLLPDRETFTVMVVVE